MKIVFDQNVDSVSQFCGKRFQVERLSVGFEAVYVRSCKGIEVIVEKIFRIP
jgi:hypothetical protein